MDKNIPVGITVDAVAITVADVTIRVDTVRMAGAIRLRRAILL